ncbi:MAG TPA: SRPBCC family protein, partial [Micropepsaceae bacterium]|nr:SRPBCC family protein [Micropepsaceae bacterium]
MNPVAPLALSKIDKQCLQQFHAGKFGVWLANWLCHADHNGQEGLAMVKIIETVRIDETADGLWHEIGRFGGVGEWHPWVSKVESEGEREGSVRTPEDRDGNQQTERLLETSPEKHFYRYRMEST